MTDPMTFYFDFSSPYGYFAAQSIDQTAAAFGRDVILPPMLPCAAMEERAPRRPHSPAPEGVV